MPEPSTPWDAPREAVTRPDVSPGAAPRPAPPLWSLRDLVLIVAFVPGAILVSEFLLLAGYAALQPLFGWHLRHENLQDNPFFLLALQSVFYGLLFGFIFFLITGYHRQPFWSALNWRKLTKNQFLGSVAGGLLLAVMVQFAPTILPDRDTFPLQELFSSSGAAYAVAVFAILVAPLMEELIFRGVLFSIFEHQVGVRFAIVSTAALFAAVHIPEYWGAWNHVLFIFFVGLALSLARGVTGSLPPSVVLHLTYNSGLVAAFFVATKHFRTLHALLLR